MKYLDRTLPSPQENIACDEQLLDTAERGDGGEVLRCWESPEPFVVVGYANRIETEVNVPACEQAGIPILRRCSGGGTVVQGPGCLSYALILNIANHPAFRDVTAANRFIMDRNQAALQLAIGHAERLAIGYQLSAIEIQGHTDLALVTRHPSPATLKKFSGNAQRRRRRFLLFHGTFLLRFDLALVSQLLPLPSRQPDYRQLRSHADFLTNLNLPAGAVKSALKTAWSATDVAGEHG
jgi:lipoate-protein ligase A